MKRNTIEIIVKKIKKMLNKYKKSIYLTLKKLVLQAL